MTSYLGTPEFWREYGWLKAVLSYECLGDVPEWLWRWRLLQRGD